MEQRHLGKTGLTVSALGFGAGNVGGLMVRGTPAERARAVARAIEAGITYFDTAPQYGQGQSEENLGRVLRELGAWHRVVVGTKVRLTPDDLRDPTAAVRGSVEASLRRLGSDAVDLLQLHNHVVDAPGGDGGPVDLQRVTEGVAEALERVKRDGLARHIGFTGLGDTSALHAVVRSGTFETVQCYFNAINPSAGFPGASGGEQDFQGLIDVAASAGLGVIAIRVLAAGALTARPERAPNAGEPGAPLIQGADYTRDLEKARAVDALAVELGLESPIELGVRFALSKREVSTVLVGYSSVEQLEDAIRWAERGPLPPEVVRRVVDLAR